MSKAADYILSRSIPEPNSGCWLWLLSVDRDGYGNAMIDYVNERAHRISFREFNGPIGDDREVHHTCRTRCCVNPEHLVEIEPVEHLKTRDCRTNHPNRRKTHCKRGHALADDNLRIIPGASPQGFRRVCLACERARA